ncbi:MAG: hypothetical protein AAFY46_11390, partial [Planctomycetota bacterium]
GGLSNEGVLVVNPEGTNQEVELRGDPAGGAVTGEGTIRLNAVGQLNTAVLGGFGGGELFRIGVHQTIVGRGTIERARIEGRLDPGDQGQNAAEIHLESGFMEFGPTSTISLDVYSLSSFDRLTGNDATIDLDGTLELHLRGGYVPSVGDSFLVLDARRHSTSLTTIREPVINGKSFRVTVTDGDVEAIWTCLSDSNADGILAPNDFNAWILAFNNDAPPCDQNGDGECRPNDFNAWVLNFNSGCP